VECPKKRLARLDEVGGGIARKVLSIGPLAQQALDALGGSTVLANNAGSTQAQGT